MIMELYRPVKYAIPHVLNVSMALRTDAYLVTMDILEF